VATYFGFSSYLVSGSEAVEESRFVKACNETKDENRERMRRSRRKSERR
jgi:hypothetical protein